MAIAARKAASDLSGHLLEKATSTQFFQLVERLYRINGINPEQALDLHPDDELIRFQVVERRQ